MNLPPLIMIAGRKGSGKDTFGQFLKEELEAVCDVDYSIKKMADPLRDEIALCLMGVPIPIIFLDEFKTRSFTMSQWRGIEVFPKPEMTGGEILQWYGTDIRRKQNPLYWVCMRFADFNLETDRWIITDGRFHNEFVACQLLGGIVIKIESDIDRTADGDNRSNQHASEADIDTYHDWYFHVKNYGTLDDLRNEARKRVNYLKNVWSQYEQTN